MIATTRPTLAQALAGAPATRDVDDEAPPTPDRPLRTPSWAARTLAASGPQGELLRLGAGLGLAASWGLAVGMYGGLEELWGHAAVVTRGLLAVVGLAIPACYILLSLFDAPLAAGDVLRASSRAVFRVGLLYAGLAPVTALYTSTVGRTGATLLVPLVFFAGGGVALWQLLSELAKALSPAPPRRKLQCYAVLFGFAVLSMSLGVRGFLALPIVGGV